MHKVIAIVGPTASGKSSIAIEAARRLNGEIISADSMQVYKGMDIGTAKITPQEMEGIPHSLIDIEDINTPWNVRKFQTLCRQKIEEICAKGKVPIVCGGTGLYVKAALYDYEFEDESESEEDQKLTAELETKTNEELYALLQELDPQALEKIHINNRKRLLRAAFMARSGKTKSMRENGQKHEPIYDVYMVGLKADRALEIERIDRRVDQMFDAGLADEVRALFLSEKSRTYNSFQAIGYKEFAPWLKRLEDDENGQSTKKLTGAESETMLQSIREQIKVHTRQYARRQMTWFNHQMPVHWFDPANKQAIFDALEDWYGKDKSI